MASYIIVAIIAYIIGSINFSVIISKKIGGFDVREKGSGNAGSTNILRTMGVKTAIVTVILDILKGVVSILLAKFVGNIAINADAALLVQIAGLCVVIGHTFPILFQFKGGKGVATSLGVLLTTNWQIGLICLIFAIIIMIFSKMVSLGSIGAAILFPILTLFMGEHYIVEASGLKYFVFSIILAVFVIFNHRENIKRIMNGTENKLSF